MSLHFHLAFLELGSSDLKIVCRGQGGALGPGRLGSGTRSTGRGVWGWSGDSGEEGQVVSEQSLESWWGY